MKFVDDDDDDDDDSFIEHNIRLLKADTTQLHNTKKQTAQN